MNKRLEKEFGEPVAEQRGWHWALTRFALDAYSHIEEEIARGNPEDKRSIDEPQERS